MNKHLRGVIPSYRTGVVGASSVLPTVGREVDCLQRGPVIVHRVIGCSV
jgi:hypothetical protein